MCMHIAQDFPPKQQQQQQQQRVSDFERTLSEYVHSLKLPGPWARRVQDVIAGADYSAARGVLIGSVPGRHEGERAAQGLALKRHYLVATFMHTMFPVLHTGVAGADYSAARGVLIGSVPGRHEGRLWMEYVWTVNTAQSMCTTCPVPCTGVA
jgi:hypothetical protein